jgi:hypothetical protein
MPARLSATNPFRPGVGKPPPYLADREEQLQRFTRYLADFPENRRNIRVFGLRGVGKTVLLKEYRKIAREIGWIVVKRDFSLRLNDEADFALAISSDLDKALKELSPVAKLKSLVDDARNSLNAVVSLGGGVTVGINAAPTPKKAILEDLLRDALLKIGQVAAHANRGVLFLYDEAHVIHDTPKARSYPLSALLGAFVEAQDYEDEDLPVMLVMCGLPALVANLQAARSHSERLFKAEPIENLRLSSQGDEPSPAASALLTAVEGSDIAFAPGIAEVVARDVDGYPYFIQWFGEALWDAADEAGIAVIDEDLYDATKSQIQEGLDNEFFEGRYGEANRAEQGTLRVLGSLGGEGFRMGELVNEMKSLKQNAVQQSVNRLTQNNLIYRVRYGEYAYTAPLFGDFLRRRHPIQPEDK